MLYNNHTLTSIVLKIFAIKIENKYFVVLANAYDNNENKSNLLLFFFITDILLFGRNFCHPGFRIHTLHINI